MEPVIENVITAPAPKVKPTLEVVSEQRIAFNDERIVLKNDDYEVHVKVLNPEYQGFYETGEFAHDPDEVDALINENVALEVTIDTLKNNVEETQGSDIAVAEMSVAIKKHVSTIAEKEAKIQDLSQENQSLGSTVSSQASTISNLSSENKSLKDSIKDNEGLIDGQTTKINILQGNLDTANEQIAALKKQIGSGKK